jgi:hypothetical protein
MSWHREGMAGGQLSRAQRARIEAASDEDRARAEEIARQQQAAHFAARPGADERPAAVHVWVHGPPEEPGPFPGLVTAWRRLPWGGWSARTTYAVPRDDADTMLVQQWLTDEQLTPLTS